MVPLAGFGDAAIADFVVRVAFGNGVVKDREGSSGTLFPMCEGELALRGIDQNEA
jgi:hypothetical protein